MDESILPLTPEILDRLFEAAYVVDRGRKIVFWNKAAERITGYAAREVLGKSCSEDILLHVDETGKTLCAVDCITKKTLADGLPHEGEIYSYHKDGHRFPVSIRSMPLRDASGATSGVLKVFVEQEGTRYLLNRLDELEKLALLDALTRLPNRRFLEEQIGAGLKRLERLSVPFGVVVMDVDRFKQVNDKNGHVKGDEALVLVAKTLSHSLRAFDTVGRWGGDEFLAVIINADAPMLAKVAERFRMLVERSRLESGGAAIPVTISAGAAGAEKNDTVETLFARADRMLYKSKQEGRNRVNVFPGAGP
ncbi:MAG: sensor domain-containing diguanylate cyclase [Thermodesulfobacteriota bacterium]